MYEDKTYEAILQEKLARVASSLDKREGSIIFDALDDGSLLVLDQEWAYLDKETWACFPGGSATAAAHAFVDYISTRFERLRLRPEMRHHVRILQKQQR